MLILIKPSLEYAESYVNLLREWVKEGAHPTQDYALVNIANQIKRWDDMAAGKELNNGEAPLSVFWLLENNEIIGHVKIVHGLDRVTRFNQLYWNLKPRKRTPEYEQQLREIIQQKVHELDISITLNDQARLDAKS